MLSMHAMIAALRRMGGSGIGRNRRKRDMKRVLAAALIALAAAGSVFAAVSGQLAGADAGGMSSTIDLTLDLSSGTEVGWFQAKPTLANWGTSSNVALEEDADNPFENDPADTVVLWAGVKSNENVQLKMEITGEQLSSTKSASTPIAVTATPGEGFDESSAVTWDGTGDESKMLVKQETEALSEARVLGAQVTFSMDTEDYNSALAADDYSADITLKVTSVG